MSDKKRHNKYHQEGEERKSANLGPAKIPKQEYYEDRDMMQAYINFTSAWESFVSVTFDPALASIVNRSELL